MLLISFRKIVLDTKAFELFNKFFNFLRFCMRNSLDLHMTFFFVLVSTWLTYFTSFFLILIFMEKTKHVINATAKSFCLTFTLLRLKAPFSFHSYFQQVASLNSNSVFFHLFGDTEEKIDFLDKIF